MSVGEPRQQILIVETERSSLRAEIHGWGCEDGSTPARDPVGLTPGVNFNYCYSTIRHAMGDGWFLMAPPEKTTNTVERDEGPLEVTFYTWWLTRTVPARRP